MHLLMSLLCSFLKLITVDWAKLKFVDEKRSPVKKDKIIFTSYQKILSHYSCYV